jgi:hypothetical protein
MPERDNSHSSAKSPPYDNFYLKLVRGEFGLFKTYWLYGVLVGFLAVLLMRRIIKVGDSPLFLVHSVFVLVYSVYQIPVSIGAWRASDNYTGLKVWAILAKITIVLVWLFLGANLIFILAGSLFYGH